MATEGDAPLQTLPGNSTPEQAPLPESTAAPGVSSIEPAQSPPLGEAGESPGGLDEAATVAAPEGGLTEPRENPKARVRRGLAWALVAILAMLVATGCAGWLFFDRNTEDFQAFAVIFAPVTTLVGTVLAFYFSSDDN